MSSSVFQRLKWASERATPCALSAPRTRRLLLWPVLCLAMALVLTIPLEAGARERAEPNYYAKPAGGITLEQAADTVRRRTGGRVLSASPVSKGGERGYNVRVLVDGKRVKQYYVDAEGRMSSR